MPAEHSEFLVLEETPRAECMLAGFDQWANAGNVSSGIPPYLVEQLQARRIGRVRKGPFYLFQLPGRHYMFRPSVAYKDGLEESYQEEPTNDFYYADVGEKGLIIFQGTEPILHEDLFASALLDAAAQLGVQRIVVPEGVAMEVPFDRERHISAMYSLAEMRRELEGVAVSLSNYSMNATIGMVLTHFAAQRGLWLARMSARVPAYQILLNDKPLVVDDRKAWLDILRRARHLLGISLDLSDLEAASRQQAAYVQAALKQLGDDPKTANYVRYLEGVFKEFEELRFEEPLRFSGKLAEDMEDLLRRLEDGS
jgi:hypothetical protein